jgi:hypothetical protein
MMLFDGRWHLRSRTLANLDADRPRSRQLPTDPCVFCALLRPTPAMVSSFTFRFNIQNASHCRTETVRGSIVGSNPSVTLSDSGHAPDADCPGKCAVAIIGVGP